MNHGEHITIIINKLMNNDDNNNNRTPKTSIITSSVCDYSDAYIFVKGNITVPKTATQRAAVNNTNKKVIFKNWVWFTSCITEINNTQGRLCWRYS